MDKEKLVELLNNSFAEQYEKRGLLTAPCTATDLIANGVATSDDIRELKADNERLRDMWAKAVSELSKEKARGVMAQTWISADNPPAEDQRVIVWLGNNRYNAVKVDTDRVHDGKWVRWGDCVTHWAPICLPLPPKET